MKNSVFAVIFSLLYWSKGVSADDAIKRGTFQFMAFIYYQDESVVDRAGARFLQSAVLIHQNYLISSSLVSSVIEDPLNKTLLARAGAVRIDLNFTLNEEEDEQEQEIIEIIRPQIANYTSWWATDISLLKTLLPFKMTSAVHVAKISTKQDYSDKICNILVFKKKNSISDGTRFLMLVAVEMLPSTTEYCGEQFNPHTMVCATYARGSSAEDRAPENFCQGNSGGPLICEGNNVTALQTYIDGSCNTPHLYQLLAPWKQFLDCGTEDNCGNQEKCPSVCSVTYKDSPSTTITTKDSTHETEGLTQSTELTVKIEQTSYASDTNTTEVESENTIETGNATTFEEDIESSTMHVNESETTWPPRRMDDDEEVKKKEADRETMAKVQERHLDAHTHAYSVESATGRSTIVLHSLIYNCLFVWICLM